MSIDTDRTHAGGAGAETADAETTAGLDATRRGAGPEPEGPRSSKPRAGAASGPPGLTIGSLSRATGIPVETLRTWERRYHAPVASRKPSGHRLYPLEAVPHLKRVKQALGFGHRPAEVLALSLPQLESLVMSWVDLTPQPRRRAARTAAVSGVAASPEVRALLKATLEYDGETLRRRLQDAWLGLGPLGFLVEVAGPFMVEVGNAWEDGRIEIRHEHFASSRLADFLREARRPFDRDAAGPTLAATTLPGDLHEVGLLMASTVFAAKGWRVLHLGIHTPVEQAASLVRDASLAGAAISVSPSVPSRVAGRSIRTLRERLPRGARLWVGGAGAPDRGKGVEIFKDLRALDASLETFRG